MTPCFLNTSARTSRRQSLFPLYLVVCTADAAWSRVLRQNTATLDVYNGFPPLCFSSVATVHAASVSFDVGGISVDVTARELVRRKARILGSGFVRSGL